MRALVIILACLGTAAIVAGAFALRRNWAQAKLNGAPTRRRLWLGVSLLLGVMLAGASWPLTYWMGYPVHIEAKPGRIVGLPVFVAYFDSDDRDYVGPLTTPGVIVNGLFWFFVSQLVIRVLAYRKFVARTDITHTKQSKAG